MAFNIQAERERRTQLAKDTRNLLDTSTGAGNTWTAENQTKYDENVAEIERIDAAIDRHQKVMDLTADNAMHDAGVREHVGGKGDKRNILGVSRRKLEVRAMMGAAGVCLAAGLSGPKPVHILAGLVWAVMAGRHVWVRRKAV